MSKARGVLYVHPYNHPQQDAIAVGSITAINSLACEVLGRYAAEVTAAEIQAARVILIDVHWFTPLGVLDGLLAAIRGLAPSVPIVVGGITAAFYGAAFLGRFDVDYVLAGDVEITLPALVSALLADGQPPPLPGVWVRDGAPPVAPRRSSPAEFDALDQLTIDWFPTLRQRALQRHARHRRADRVPSDPTYPTLITTRGCRRDCRFCYGSYHRQVFGSGMLVRSPEILVRDLTRLSDDPELAFVTWFASEASQLERYVSALAAQRFELDGYVFCCGVTRPDVLDGIRAAFVGEVVFSFIQPRDLAGPGADTTAEAFGRQLAHIEQMERTWAAVYHVGEPEPAALAAAERGASVELMTARDWHLVRPDELALRETSEPVAGQLERVTQAGRSLAAIHLARSLVHPLPALLPDCIELPTLERRLGLATDPFVRRLLELLVRQIVDHGLYGCDELRLGWTSGPVEAGFRVGWTEPGERRGLDGEWRAALGGFEWEGELEVPADGPLAVAPLAMVVVAGQEVDFSQWSQARLPAVEVRPGPRRMVQLGGREATDGLVLWVEDDGRREEHWLASGERKMASQEHAGAMRSAPLAAAITLSTPLARRPWPSRAWPRAVLTELAKVPRGQLGEGWRFRVGRLDDATLQLWLRGPDGVAIELSVFARASGDRFLSTQRFSIAYPAAAESWIGALAPLILRLLAAAERVLEDG